MKEKRQLNPLLVSSRAHVAASRPITDCFWPNVNVYRTANSRMRKNFSVYTLDALDDELLALLTSIW